MQIDLGYIESMVATILTQIGERMQALFDWLTPTNLTYVDWMATIITCSIGAGMLIIAFNLGINARERASGKKGLMGWLAMCLAILDIAILATVGGQSYLLRREFRRDIGCDVPGSIAMDMALYNRVTWTLDKEADTLRMLRHNYETSAGKPDPDYAKVAYHESRLKDRLDYAERLRAAIYAAGYRHEVLNTPFDDPFDETAGSVNFWGICWSLAGCVTAVYLAVYRYGDAIDRFLRRSAFGSIGAYDKK